MARIYMSGISLCATKQRYTLIYFDGEDCFGATDKSPENLVDMFSGMRFQALAEGIRRKIPPECFDFLYFQGRQSIILCICSKYLS